MSIDRRRVSGGYVPLRDAINQLFEGSFITPHMMAGSGNFPPVDMYLTENEAIIEMAAPGVNPNDLNISVTGDTLTVSGEVKRSSHSQKNQPYHEEIWRGRFQRSFQLPFPADPNKAEATFDNGVLTLVVPKTEAARPRKIQVQQRGSSAVNAGQQSSIESGRGA
jgi:HSP20 family protein